MLQTFREYPAFTKARLRYLSDDDFGALQKQINDAPEAAPQIRSTGGARKMRFALPGGGKSGGLRVIYFAYGGLVHLFTMYPKSKTESLSGPEKAALQQLTTLIKQRPLF
jgi:hypothetical protein